MNEEMKKSLQLQSTHNILTFIRVIMKVIGDAKLMATVYLYTRVGGNGS